MTEYNYTKFSSDEYELAKFGGPEVGARLPNFELAHPDGSKQSILDFDGRFLVLEIGSATCPLFQGRRASMQDLNWNHPDVEFAVLYVREAHPGGAIPSHETWDDKCSQAMGLQRRDNEGRNILVDDINGTVHAALGGYPNSVYIINRNGCVLYRSDWNDTKATAKAIECLRAGKPANVKSYFKPVSPKVSMRVLHNAGQGAFADFARSFPSLVWNNLVVRNARQLLGRPVGVHPDIQC